jgi:hypothetical protein
VVGGVCSPSPSHQARLLAHSDPHAQAYIDFEIGENERQRTRVLYERLLDRTQHVKVWLSFGRFEAAPLPNAEEEG